MIAVLIGVFKTFQEIFDWKIFRFLWNAVELFIFILDFLNSDFCHID